MRNRWSEQESANLSDVDLLVYMSRLAGSDPSLVLWGGGNTSIKRNELDFRGRPTRVLRVKGSGSDLKSVRMQDFSGVRLDDALLLEARDEMSDEEMVAYLAQTLMEPGSPRPSIETLLHAFIPAAAVLHSHADAVVALTNTADGAAVLQRALGDSVIPIPYRRPGFLLSKEVAEAARARPGVRGVVLMNHGLVTWAETAREAYALHIEIVGRAEEYAAGQKRGRRVFGGVKTENVPVQERHRAAAALAPLLRGMLSQRQRVILRYDDDADILDFVNSEEADRLSQIGPATPDHLLNTKRLPVFVRPVEPTNTEAVAVALREALRRYEEEYLAYVDRQNHDGVVALPPEPRIVLVAGLGMWSCGRDVRAARIAGEIYHHTIAVMAGAQAVGSYTSLSEEDAFQAEYWPMELYKLTLQPGERPLARRIALVSGAARGIGYAIAERFVSEGANVVLADIDGDGAAHSAAMLNERHGEGRCLALTLDVTDEREVAHAFETAGLAYGGLDILVSNAGIALNGSLADMPLGTWERSLAVNATGHFLLTRESLRLMRGQDLGGSLIYIASKNVTAPGADFGAYSAAKAAEAQLARIAAIEGGPLKVRANILNPDAIFEGSGLFSQALRESRARAHGIAPEDLEEFYRRRNLLQARVFAEDVAAAALFLAGDESAKTTGAMLPVDGGVREAFPR